MVIKDKRIYKNSRHITARWPESGLIEVQKYKLVCVLGGAIDYPIADYTLQCDLGHFIFFPPGLPHTEGKTSYINTNKSTFCETVSFLLHPNAIQYWINHWQGARREYKENALISDQRVTLLFQMLMEEIYEQEEPSETLQEAFLIAFFSLLRREVDTGRISYLYSREPDVSMPQRTSGIDFFDFCSALKRYIEMNINKPITTQDAARAMYLSRAQFTRTVRHETGMSFNEFLSVHRVEQAKELLRNTDWTISFIAESVGFTSSSYFRTFFRKHTGQTPSEFRHRIC